MNALDDAPREFGPELGATLWGGTLYELGAGETSPYHWHYGEEEFLIVVAGRPTLRTPDGERELEPWDTAWFPCGERGAHQVRNGTNEPARVLFFSSLSDPEVAVYPDTNEVAVFAGWSDSDPGELRFKIERP